MATLAEAKTDLGIVRRQLEEHNRSCPCRHVVRGGKRPTCEGRADLEGQRRKLIKEIKTWFDMPDDAETLF